MQSLIMDEHAEAVTLTPTFDVNKKRAIQHLSKNTSGYPLKLLTSLSHDADSRRPTVSKPAKKAFPTPATCQKPATT